jgi:hypothetical protein
VKTLKNPKLLLAAILIGIIAITPIPHAYSSNLTLTIFTTKPSYTIEEEITLYGNLTYNSLPVPNWPVALEVQDPLGTPVVTRTLQTNTSGTYTLTFKLPTNAKLGTYTAYVSSSYKGETATNSTTFELMPRDIAVTNVTLSKTVIAQGYSMKITATVENQGYPTETFNVTVYANTTSIATQTVTLTSGNSTTIAFTWNTIGFAKGNYTIRAYAWPVPGETHTADNTLTDGWVIVAMIGDIIGPYGWPDGKCDIRDVASVAKLFGVNYPDPRYNPNCDLTGPTPGLADGKIDIRDIATVAKNFGKIDP